MRNSSKAAILVAMILASLAAAPGSVGAQSLKPPTGSSVDPTFAATDWRPRCHAIKDGWTQKMACPGGKELVVGWGN